MTDAPVLSLAGFGVAIHGRVILADVTLDVPQRGVTVLMGPAGTGKSTLLRTLSGLNEAQPELSQWGSALYQGERLGLSNRPTLVQQDVRYFVSTVRENLVSSFPDRRKLTRGDQDRRLEALLEAQGVQELREHLDDEALSLPTTLRRLLAVLKVVATDAPLICLDETTAGLEAPAAARVLELIRSYAQTRAVLFVTHHQLHARAVADACALLAGGRVQEVAPASTFFHSPTTAVLRHYLSTGSVGLPSPDAAPDSLAEGVSTLPLPPPARVISHNVGPRGFRWLQPGRLGGCPRPGIVAPLDEDLEGLRRLGVSTLVTLEETPTVAASALDAHGVATVHFPIDDMAAPETVATAELCRRIDYLLRAGEVIAYHCRAGLGRTGTLLACQLIWSGATDIEALDRVRSVNPKWVQSDVQVRFLETFSNFVRWQSGPSTEQLTPLPAPQPRGNNRNVS